MSTTTARASKRVSTILFLEGVYKRDCRTTMDDVHEDRLRINTASHEARRFDKIPLLFTSLDRWPTSTNILCWWCRRSFRGRPWFVPKSVEPNVVQPDDHRQVVMTPEGNFCTAHCAAAYINATYIGSDRYNRHSMLKYLYRIIYGKNTVEITPSPSPYEMAIYGGNLSEVEYSTKISKLENNTADLEDQSFANICRMYIKGT
jgi:hypothetical protein